MERPTDTRSTAPGTAGPQDPIAMERDAHLRLAEKMEAVGMLAGGVAHELNNILSGILGFTSYLMAKADPDSELYRDLTLVEQSATRAVDLARQLLSFARQRHFQREAVSLYQIIDKVLAALVPGLAGNIVIEKRLAEDLPQVLGNADQLAEVVRHLCLNAADAMAEKGGVIEVSAEKRSLTDREHAVLVNAQEGPYVCVAVKDAGRGMSPEALRHVFDPFYTTKFQRGGVGLGMAIVYGIVTNHHGSILAESVEGQGTTFRLYFPVHTAEIPAKATVTQGKLDGTETILLVDDEPIVRQVTTAMLKTHGYKVVPAESGEEALKMFQELAGRVDLVILDLLMPGMGGEATFRELRKIRSDVAVLLSSGYAQEEITQRLAGLGIRGMVYKPFRVDQLLTAVRSALVPGK